MVTIVIDTAILSAIISAIVAIFIAVLNHFIVTPIKEKKNWKREQLKVLYAPLYSLICLRISIVKEASLKNKQILLGNDPEIKYQTRSYMENFMLDRLGYSFNDLMNAWVNYASQFSTIDKEHTEGLVIAVVKGYNQLRKELKLPYDELELETGIPEVIKEYRELINK